MKFYVAILFTAKIWGCNSSLICNNKAANLWGINTVITVCTTIIIILNCFTKTNPPST